MASHSLYIYIYGLVYIWINYITADGLTLIGVRAYAATMINKSELYMTYNLVITVTVDGSALEGVKINATTMMTNCTVETIYMGKHSGGTEHNCIALSTLWQTLVEGRKSIQMFLWCFKHTIISGCRLVCLVVMGALWIIGRSQVWPFSVTSKYDVYVATAL